MKQKAFTLAEVLITLGIIGVVAAMTIPTLISNYQKSITIQKLKKIYSTLNQAYQMSTVDNGPFNQWQKHADIGGTKFFYYFWQPYLAGATVCKTYQECGYKEQKPWQTLAGERKDDVGVCDNTDDNRVSFYLQDGSFISMSASLYVDINGGQGPNIYGKDFFILKYGEKGVLPADNNFEKDRLLSYCSKNNNNESALCAARLILYDNWEIKDDYPW